MKMLTLIPILSLLILAGCPQTSGQTFEEVLEDMYEKTVPLIKAKALNKELQQGEKVLFLDTREAEEYGVSHIQNAIAVGYDDLDLQCLDNVAKDTKIVVYCSVGYRSERVGEKILEKGFSNVYNLYGGIFEWVNHDFPVYNKQNAIADSVHVYNEKWGQWCLKGTKVY